jgi:hypothetical protein
MHERKKGWVEMRMRLICVAQKFQARCSSQGEYNEAERAECGQADGKDSGAKKTSTSLRWIHPAPVVMERSVLDR